MEETGVPGENHYIVKRCVSYLFSGVSAEFVILSSDGFQFLVAEVFEGVLQHLVCFRQLCQGVDTRHGNIANLARCIADARSCNIKQTCSKDGMQ